MPQTLEVRKPITEAIPESPVSLVPEVAPPRTEGFTAEEVVAFHADDKHAAAAIAGIMMAIFSAALVAYVFIACWVFTWPM